MASGRVRLRDRDRPVTDAGSATVAGIGAVVAFVAMGAAVAAGAGAVRAEALAQAVADAAALSGAASAREGGEGCGTALDVAVANSAELVGCVADGAVVTVRVAVPSPFAGGALADAVAGPRW